ncbi:hypothetical protein [Pectobacterium versatile]|uniref:hypothetical protein n=1 Tax=Pectobacterium versatile TaxID=2488639 RepID=UPI00398CF4FE
MARQTRPLTNTEVKAAKTDDKPVVLYDGDGLELLIKPRQCEALAFSLKNTSSR